MKAPAWLRLTLPDWSRGFHRAADHGRLEEAPPARLSQRLRRAEATKASRRTAAPSAREMFPLLRARLLASRPVIGWTDETDPERAAQPIYGAPTFRNVIDESGRHV